MGFELWHDVQDASENVTPTLRGINGNEMVPLEQWSIKQCPLGDYLCILVLFWRKLAIRELVWCPFLTTVGRFMSPCGPLVIIFKIFYDWGIIYGDHYL